MVDGSPQAGGPQQQQQPQRHQPKAKEFVKSLSDFFKRDLISIPLIAKHQHAAITQRCQLKAATLEFDTSAYPNIDYIAGNRLSIYPVNPAEHVTAIMRHLVDDIGGASGSATSASSPTAAGQQLRPRMSQQWAKFFRLNKRDSLRLALTYLYDICTAPSRDLLRLMAESCSNKEHKTRLIALSRTEEAWERWVFQSLRTLKSTFEEFNSCKLSAKSLFSELTLQQPRQYSISCIKSLKRVRVEIRVFQHKFNQKQIANSMQNFKEGEQMLQQQQQQQQQQQRSRDGRIRSPIMQQPPTTVHVNHDGTKSQLSSSSVRSLRSVATFGTSPITTQQVKMVPSYSGPLMSLYAAASSISGMSAVKSNLSNKQAAFKSTISNTTNKNVSLLNNNQLKADSQSSSSSSSEKLYDGLCSNYLLNLQNNDYVVCEFVENPRFTLKGNRERPIMMIGQEVGVVAFRTFWQQRAVEHDRAQMFYSLFKDLAPKKFGDMKLVCLTGHRSQIESLFKRELAAVVAAKVLSSASYINKQHLSALLDTAANTANQVTSTIGLTPQSTSGLNIYSNIQIEAKELIDLGNRIAKLLIEQNGCLYTCCDSQLTQAIEILVVESIARNNYGLTRENCMNLLPKWKGRKTVANDGEEDQPVANRNTINNEILYRIENPFEKAQIVQEIYDPPI